ncbi:MAG: phosphotransferase family protein [bacterium]
MQSHDDLSHRIADRLTAAFQAEISVRSVRPLVGGACQDGFRVDFEGPDGAGRLALRSDARSSLPGSIDRAAEFAVIEAARAQGALTPAARWLSADLVRPGATAYFVDWLEGEAIGARVTRHPALAAARPALPAQLATTLAAIHRVTPATHPTLPIARAPFGRGEHPARAAVGFLRVLLDQVARPRPAAEAALRWLADQRLPPGPPTLVHGDFRTGNFMVGPTGLVGVFDWEFAHWGDPDEDLAWLCVRDWRFGQVTLPVGGVGHRAPFYAAYGEAAGRPVDPARVHFWEVAGNLRWGSPRPCRGSATPPRGTTWSCWRSLGAPPRWSTRRCG